MPIEITGKVTKIIYSNNEYNICLIEVDGDYETVLFNYPNIKIGFVGDFTGDWIKNPSHGKQFKATFAMERLPDTKDGFTAYLQSGVFKGIGAVTAKRITDFLGDQPLDVMKHDIDKLLKVPKVKLSILQNIMAEWVTNGTKTQIVVFLQQYGITGTNIDKIYDRFHNDSINVIRGNPYILIYYITGIGFKTADKIALRVGIKEDSELRIIECIKYVLESDSGFGSCYLLDSQVIERVKEYIGVNDKDLIYEYLKVCKDIVKLNINNEDRYYSHDIYYNERLCLTSILSMLNAQQSLQPYNYIDDGMLSTEQKLAVQGILSNKISILTGGPGVGKSFSTKTIVDNLLSMGKEIGVCAPTGKAAIRSTILTGFEAKTIHRLLIFDPITGGFIHNYSNKLPYDFIIVDESSMIDINLMSSLLTAISDDCQVLFVGDYDQLPPVGAGAPFKDMIESNIIPVYRLTKIFRQSATSKIITTAHKINIGKYEHIESPIKNPEMWTNGSDCMFIDSGMSDNRSPSSYKKESTLAYGINISQMIVKLFIETINKYRKYSDIQILVPKRVGELGSNNLNKLIQEAVNPIKYADQQLVLKDKQFRVNDKVIHTRNNYKLAGGIFNGEIGIVIEINTNLRYCLVEYDDKTVKYEKSDLYDLELAFALTIHKSQGSEFECVILPLMPEYNIMLERSLIYTGLTRAKKLAVFIGNRQSLYRSIDNVNKTKRQTSLSELLINEVVSYENVN